VFDFEFILVIYPPTILGGPWRLTKRKSRRIRGSDLMSLNNSRGFPSILLVNISILHAAGKTKLSKNGKKNMRFFVILLRSTKNKEQCLWLFYTRYSSKSICVRVIEAIIKLFDFDL